MHGGHDQQHVIPAVKNASSENVNAMKSVKTIKDAVAGIHAKEDDKAKAELARTLRLETMVDIRKLCDEAEAVTAANL